MCSDVVTPRLCSKSSYQDGYRCVTFRLPVCSDVVTPRLCSESSYQDGYRCVMLDFIQYLTSSLCVFCSQGGDATHFYQEAGPTYSFERVSYKSGQ